MADVLPYGINDADNHFNEPPDLYEKLHRSRQARPRDPLRHRRRTASELQLFAGKPSKFTVTQVTYSNDELRKMLGDDPGSCAATSRRPSARTRSAACRACC